MNKFEPNMYVRTIDGIMKVNNIYQDGRENMDRFENEAGNIYFFNEIIGEPSFNPIDLIEVGDYVNGSLVININYDINLDEDVVESISIFDYSIEGFDVLHEKDIKTIVTKEQFESVSYRIGDEK